MTTPGLTPSPAQPIPGPIKRKRVLLVDTSAPKRDLRAEAMRKFGMEVDCAADILEARSWWRADLYDLVLINTENELGHRDKFCEDMRGATPPQQLAFLVGKPGYLAGSPNMDEAPFAHGESDQILPGGADSVPSAAPFHNPHQRWGILEASRRISAVRSLSHARSKAMRERPAPPRDSEIRMPKRTMESRSLDELLREEMQ